ncbi:oxidoreductase [Streptomyces kronopolitis]|uniref:Oxidoreductase n=1 Tax=Streptomyces kronopolitis TaxID=1612435 RepID=A0ABQ2J199_9ACTN|nr:Gfo/Idh/MocA family oxidoreductase [Streptomyces kronopolitis]GGN36576.1 oxidoreductase [Streptomyces kronopolitis]
MTADRLADGRPGTAELRIGVLGCADIARRRMLPALAARPGIRVAAVASRAREKAKSFAMQFGCDADDDYERLLARPDLDAVYIPLPTGLHALWTARALEAGKHVLVEKSATGTLAEAQDVVALARERGLALMENFAFVHHSQHATAKQRLLYGEIGELRVLQASFGIPPRPPGDIRYRRELGGGALLDVGAYPLRAALMYLGDGVQVIGAVLRVGSNQEVDTAGSVLLASPDGVTAELSFGFEHGYRSHCALWGTEGRLVLDQPFTPPTTARPILRLSRQDHVQQFVLDADDQFGNTAASFAGLSQGPATVREEQYTRILRQAALLSTVRDTARVLRSS